MINFKQGSIKNLETGEEKDIVVKAITPNSLKDILIGGGLIMTGVIYIAVTAFKKGSKAFEDAKFKTLSDLDLIKDIEDDNCAIVSDYIE